MFECDNQLLNKQTIMFQIEFDSKEIQEALPQYKYIKRLGSGAFATVHLVERRDNQEQLALKKITCFGMGEYEKAGAANEARILSSFDHKNLIKVHSCLFDTNEDIMYIFMEYADSGDLTTLIEQAKEKKKRIPQSTIWKIISDVSDGLHYLHKNQVIHRDLKPANIFRLGKSFKIGDMNVSKVLKNGVAATTKTGSPLYSAPQVWDSQQYDNKCDIWSLGVLIYELCVLKVPFQAENITQLTNKIKNEKSRPLPTIYSSVLDDLVRKMLEPSPKKRITAQQVFKISNEKLRRETQVLEQNGVQNLMDTIVFPDTHQRWINLIPPSLPPKTGRKQNSGSQIQERNNSILSRSKQKKQKTIMENNSGIFRSTQKRPINLPRSKSRSRIQREKEQLIKVPNLPPIYRSNSPMGLRKHEEPRLKSSQKRDLSSSSRERKSIIQYINQAKSVLTNND